MKTLILSDEDFEELVKLSLEHQEIYGASETVWDFDDLENLCEIGTEFISLLSVYLKQVQENA